MPSQFQKQPMKPDYRALCEELLKHLEWYIEEDETNENEENAYWLKGKQDAMEVVSKAKKVIEEKPEVGTGIDRFNAVMNSIPSSHRYRWCNAEACFCMGCVNLQVLKAGFTQTDHQEWVRRTPPTNTIDNYWGVM